MVEKIWESGRLTNNGPYVRELERRIEEYLSVKHCVLVANGTLGLEVAAKALGLTGEVIMPSWTFVATAHAMSWIGLTPVFIDVKSHHLDPSLIDNAITEKTSAILPVHTWGKVGDIDWIWDVSCEYGLSVVCDAAHAFGCSHHGTMIGNFGDAEVFSFHATKFFGTFEGGAITTNDPELAQKCREMRNFGFVDYDIVVSEGTNAKMSEIHAAMGLCLFDRLDEIVAWNYHNYRLYKERLGDIMVLYDENEKQNYQYIVIETLARDLIVDKLSEIDVLARRYFYPGIHRIDMYRYSDGGVRPMPHPYSGALALPETEHLARHTICLPTGPSVTEKDITRICDVVEGVCRL